MLKTNSRRATYGLRIIGFGLLKILVGLFILWGQFEFQEPGTVYGIQWPRTLQEFFADLRTVATLFYAAWLIWTGVRGERSGTTRPRLESLINLWRPIVWGGRRLI